MSRRPDTYPRADEAVRQARPVEEAAPHPSFRLAFNDPEFLLRPEMRGVRLMLELMKPDRLQDEAGIGSTVVVFGSARIAGPEAVAAIARDGGDAARAERQLVWYEEARRFARLITEAGQGAGRCELVVVTGGGPGIMEAGNRGATEAGGKTIGLSIVLPREQVPNRWITPELSFQFHYFGIRKMQFLMRAKALAVFPGGFGTMDELFETLTLVQTRKIRRLPILLFHRAFWDRVVRFEVLAEEGLIDHADLDLIRFVETAEEGAEAIRAFYGGELLGAEEEPPPV
ncbi:LOG family protein [Elioraea tepidiphila]|uniref:LOG family protein n=1 Tax=Elioraea tepidiphila TaxID=457934 RepID=UPI0003765BED|nr:LOG family protein [Elioraea tepidiphila]